jgi:hypothetical protein
MRAPKIERLVKNQVATTQAHPRICPVKLAGMYTSVA